MKSMVFAIFSTSSSRMHRRTSAEILAIALRLMQRMLRVGPSEELRLLDDQGDGSQHDGDYRIVRLVL